MKRHFIIALSFAFLLSCSSRKVHKENLEYSKDIAKTVVKEQDGVKVVTTDFNYVFDKKNLSYEPVDNSKPMSIGGKEYVNTKITESEHKEKGTSKIKDSTALKSKEIKELKEKEKASLKAKETESKGINFIFGYIAVTLVIVLLIYLFIYIKNRIKKPTL